MDTVANMLVFARVAESGSISSASRALGKTPSAISKQIAGLEDHVGHRLLHRTRSGVSLTEEGKEYYAFCRGLADKYAEAEAHISSAQGQPQGQLRIASSVAFGKSQLIPSLPDFLDEYPDIRVSLELTDRDVDIEEENFDVAISFAEQHLNPNVTATKIKENERILCASPAFLKRYGRPKSFRDLENFNCLRTSTVIGRNAWTAELNGTSQTVDANGNFSGNSADAVFVAALMGLGIARLSTYIVEDSIASGRLVRLFPEYTQKHADIAVIFAGKRNLAPKTRAFVNFLTARFRPVRMKKAS